EPDRGKDDRGAEVRLEKNRKDDEPRIDAGEDEVPHVAYLLMAAREVFREERDQGELREVRGLEGDGAEGKPCFRAEDGVREHEERRKEREREQVGRDDDGRPPYGVHIGNGAGEEDEDADADEEELARSERFAARERMHGENAEEREGERYRKEGP